MADDGVLTLIIDNPPVNALSQAVRKSLMVAVLRTDSDPEVKALVIACAGKTFSAGADIKEFGKPMAEPLLPDVIDAIGACTKPVIAAIHGSALGGGLEVALACHHRVATATARFGFPEVKLGLIPGARGTQLLPRLVGVGKALEIVALGNLISATQALDIKLIDEIVSDDLLEAALAVARREAESHPRPTRDLPAIKVDEQVYRLFSESNAKRFRGLDAPPATINCIRAATELPFEEGAKLERETFLRLLAGPQSAALRHIFFAEREARKVPGLEGVAPRPIAKAAVIGSGTMGSGIALALVSADIPVILFDSSPAALDRGLAHIRRTLDNGVKAGRMTGPQAETAAALIAPVQDLALLADADIVVEAAYENIEVKKQIFSALDQVVRADAILASNTSYLDIDAIAAATSRPADVLGLHFFSPANIMKLLEVVRGRDTAADVLATAFALADRMGKSPVLSGNAHGFIGNRMLAVRRQHAEAMLVQGAAPERIDAVLEGFGFPMGPFRMADLAGLDLGWSAETSTGSTIRERLCDAGRRGQKSGAGFYDYDDRRKPAPSSQALLIIQAFAQDHQIGQRPFSDDEILDRLLWPMVDEGAKLLAEGIALRESDIDVVWLNGYGWPAWTGGPMFHARKTGLADICRRLEAADIRPSRALMKLVTP